MITYLSVHSSYVLNIHLFKCLLEASVDASNKRKNLCFLGENVKKVCCIITLRRLPKMSRMLITLVHHASDMQNTYNMFLKLLRKWNRNIVRITYR